MIFIGIHCVKVAKVGYGVISSQELQFHLLVTCISHYYYAFTNVVAGGIMFPECFVRASERA